MFLSLSNQYTYPRVRNNNMLRASLHSTPLSLPLLSSRSASPQGLSFPPQSGPIRIDRLVLHLSVQAERNTTEHLFYTTSFNVPLNFKKLTKKLKGHEHLTLRLSYAHRRQCGASSFITLTFTTARLVIVVSPWESFLF